MSRITSLGALVALGGAACFWAAFQWGTIAPAFGGAAVLGTLLWARRCVAPGSIDVERHLPRHITAGQPFSVTIRAAGGPDAPLRVDDVLPAGVMQTSVAHTIERGAAVTRYTATAQAPGHLRWKAVRIATRDPWGLWDIEEDAPAPGNAHVGPEPEWAIRGRGAGRRNRVRTTIRNRRGSEPRPDVEHVREYRPGDRVRDIDWKRGSRQDGMWTREREKAAARPVIVLLDATPSMRNTDGRSRLATAARLATSVANAAEAAGVRAACVAFHEGGVFHDPDLSAPQGPRGVLQRVALLPPPTDQGAGPDTDTVRLQEGERTFLQRASIAAPGPALPPWQAALGVLETRSTMPGLVVACIDAEAHPKQAIAMVRRLHAKSMDVIVCVPATGPHRFRRATLDAAQEQAVRTAYANRALVERVLAPLRIPVLPVTPDNVDAVTEEVARCAR